MILVKKGANML